MLRQAEEGYLVPMLSRHAAHYRRHAPGATASVPSEIPGRGWWQVARRVWSEVRADQVPLLAAGVAFFGFLALFPGMIAAITVYGLVADPVTVAEQSREVAAALPDDAASLVTTRMEALAEADRKGLGTGLAAALALALWSAANGVGNLVTAVNIAYDEEETRSFLRRKLLSLALTLGAVVFVVLSVGLVAVAPAVLDVAVDGRLWWGLQALRWLGLLVAMMVALALVYRLAPDRDTAQVAWVSVGAVVATVLWMLASLGFSLFVDTLGRYSEIYGALAGGVVLMLWLWLTAFIVLLGAQVNGELERQTAEDSTVGPDMPLGERGAVVADTLPGGGRH